MRRIEFSMTCGYVGSDITEIVEFPDDATDMEIEQACEYWFWDNFDGSFSWEEEAEEEEEEE